MTQRNKLRDENEASAIRLYARGDWSDPDQRRHYLIRLIGYAKAWLDQHDRRRLRRRDSEELERRYYLLAYTYDAMHSGDILKAHNIMTRFWLA